MELGSETLILAGFTNIIGANKRCVLGITVLPCGGGSACRLSPPEGHFGAPLPPPCTVEHKWSIVTTVDISSQRAHVKLDGTSPCEEASKTQLSSRVEPK